MNEISLVNTESGERIILEKDRVLVGRLAKSRHIGLKSRLANKAHALLDKKNGHVRVADLGSGNGTWLNGRLLAPGTYAELFDGDEIVFADEMFRFEKKERIMNHHEEDLSGHDHINNRQHPYVHYL